MFDGKAFGEDIVSIVRGYCEREISPLKAENESLKQRIAALEARPGPEKGEKGDDGLSPEPEAIAEAFAPLAEQIITDALAKAVADLPPPEKGEKGEDGKDADMAEINEAIGAMVQAAVATIPIPEDGKDGADGRGVKSLLIDRDGELVATMDDGAVQRLGPVVGKDGEKGKDGRDGFRLEDFDCRVLDDDRTIEFAFKSESHEHIATLKWPTVIDRGVFKAERDEPYEPGDGVTWGGQFYICNEETNLKPDQSKDGKPWRLAVRKGRDGKDKTKE